MSAPQTPRWVDDTAAVAEIADRIAEAAAVEDDDPADRTLFVFDLEFASDGRYLPELGLVQVAWGDAEAPTVCLLDPLAADVTPIAELVADPTVGCVAHAGTQDLMLLSQHFGVAAEAFFDTQIAAAFAGIGEQVGYARMVQELFGINLDKGPQFTNWLERPLSAKQLRYAAADVIHLHRAWPELSRRLQKRGRLSWAAEESARIADAASKKLPPDQAYLRVGGARALRGPSLGALRRLAQWRENEAAKVNKPVRWVLPDNAMVDVCRRLAKTERDLSRVRGIGTKTAKRYGDVILAAIREGADDPPERSERGPDIGPAKPLFHVGQALVESRCLLSGLPARFAGSKADVEAMIGWFVGGEKGELPALLTGWRAELVGNDLLAFLRGESGVVADKARPGAIEIS